MAHRPRQYPFLKFARLSAAFFAGISLSQAVAETTQGQDVRTLFHRAEAGMPLRFVALGGSITEASNQGWIGTWLRAAFPKSTIATFNAGMSGTGSSLGVYRVERDVISRQPDLVVLEYCVNDGGETDENTILAMESLIVRLKSQPHPPAIIIIEAASQQGVNLDRHRQVARHYGLFEVDLQAAVDDHLKANNLPWSTFFSDNVHPNKEGHKFYEETITAALQKLLATPYKETPPAALPAPISQKPLILDGNMFSLGTLQTEGWKREASIPFWWDKFFLGVLSSEKPDATLRIPIRGTMIGLLFPMHTEYGSFLASVDGTGIRQVLQNTRDGFAYTTLARDLPAQEHLLEIAVAKDSKGPVKLGYVLVSGQSSSTNEVSPQGRFSSDVLSQMSFTDITAAKWHWSGPYPLVDPKAQDARAEIHTAFAPEGAQPADIKWQPLSEQQPGWINFQGVAPLPSILYAKTEIDAPEAEQGIIGFAADYFAKLWINGELVTSFDGPHGAPRSPAFVPYSLKKGKNEILIKLGSGSLGYGFSLAYCPLPSGTKENN